MGFYIELFVFTSLLALIAQYFVSSAVKKILVIIIFLILLFVIGFRSYTVGSDTPTYVNLYNSIGTFSINWGNFFSSRFEIGFLKYLAILHMFSSNYMIMLFVSALIVLICWYWSIDILSTNFFLSFGIFIGLRIFTFSMTNLRQSLAMGLVLVSYLLFVKRKKKLALIMLIVAVTFHTSAIVFLVYYIIDPIKLTAKIEIFLTGLTILAMLMFQPIVRMISQIFLRFDSYTQTPLVQGTDKVSIIINIVMLILIFLVMQYVNKYLPKKNNDYENFDFESSYNKIIFLGILFSIISLKFVMLSRLTYYFSMFAVFSIPETLNRIRDTWLRNIMSIIIFLVFLIYALTIMYLRPEWNVLVPYSSSLVL